MMDFLPVATENAEMGRAEETRRAGRCALINYAPENKQRLGHLNFHASYLIDLRPKKKKSIL